MRKKASVVLLLVVGAMLLALSRSSKRGPPTPARPPLAKAIAPQAGPLDPMPVVLADGTNHLTANVLGVPANPMTVTISGGSSSGSSSVASPIELNTTGATPNHCLVVCTASVGGCHVQEISIINESNVSAQAGVFAGVTTCPTAWTNVMQTIPVPPAAGAGTLPQPISMLGNDHFGAGGTYFDGGCVVALSSTALGNGAGGAGTFTASASNFDIEAKGSLP